MMLIKSILVFLALHQIVSAQPVDVNEVTPYAFESKINETLEQLRGVIKNGIPEKGIPVLDPFQLDNFETNIDIEKVIRAYLGLNDVSFKGAGDFKVTNLKLSVITFKLTFDAIIPRMELFGHYDTDGTLMQFIELVGKGVFGTTIDNLKISGTATVSIAGGLAIKTLNLNLSVENVEFALTGLMNNEDFSKGLVDAINQMATPILNDFEKEISAAVSVFLLDLLNSFLKPGGF